MRPTLCTTSTVQDYVLHHRPALCTTNMCCAPWCIRGTFVRELHVCQSVVASCQSASCMFVSHLQVCLLACCTKSGTFALAGLLQNKVDQTLLFLIARTAYRFRALLVPLFVQQAYFNVKLLHSDLLLIAHHKRDLVNTPYEMGDTTIITLAHIRPIMIDQPWLTPIQNSPNDLERCLNYKAWNCKIIQTLYMRARQSEESLVLY